jgi:hypothetical protein
VAGEGQEHLVEAGLAEGEVVDQHAGACQLGQGAGGLLVGRGPGADGDARGQRQRVGLGLHLRVEHGVEHPLGLSLLRRLAQPQVHGPGADGRLQLAGGALGNHLAVVDHGDPTGQPVGLVQVLGGE